MFIPSDVFPPRATFWLVLAFVLAVRLAAIIAQWESLQADPDAYRQLSENIVRTGTLGDGDRPSAYRPPLYPFLLVPCVLVDRHWSGAAVAGLHVTLGTASCLLAWRWAVRQRLPFPWLAAGLLALDPILLRQSAQVMTETTATFLAAAILAAANRPAATWRLGHSLLLGALLGAGCLCRPTFLVWAALIVGYLTLRSREYAALRQLVAVVATAGAVLAPWIIRNWAQFGTPIATTTHGGYTLLLGNNDSLYDWMRDDPWAPAWRAEELEPRLLARFLGLAEFDESARDRAARDLAWETIRNRPADFFLASTLRIVWLWSPLPQRTADDEGWVHRLARWAIAVWYLAVYLLAALGVASSWRSDQLRAWVIGTLLIASLTLVHSLYWSNLRMRAPAMPVVALAAAQGVATLRKRTQKK